jgi:hypothetical protein
MDSVSYDIFRELVINYTSFSDVLMLSITNKSFAEMLERNNQRIYSDFLSKYFLVESEFLPILKLWTPKRTFEKIAKYPSSLQVFNNKINLRNSLEAVKFFCIWLYHVDDIKKIIENHYPKLRAPSWVIYDKFIDDMLSRISSDFIDELYFAFSDGESGGCLCLAYKMSVVYGSEMFYLRNDIICGDFSIEIDFTVLGINTT